MLRRLGDAEIEADNVEEWHRRQRDTLRAVKVRNMKDRDVTARKERFRQLRPVQQSGRVGQTFGH